MTLQEIRTLLKFKDAPKETCGTVNALLDARIRLVGARIEALRSLARYLKALRRECDDKHVAADCGILRSLTCRAGAARWPPPTPS